MNDLRFACRQLLKNPGFTAVAMLTLALGIGANTAVFSLIHELLFRPLRVKNAESLVGIVLIDRGGDFANQRIPYPIYRDYHEQTRSLSELFAYAEVRAPVQIGEDTRSDLIQLVSANFFNGLGAIPILGRTFSTDDDRTPAQTPAVVISHRCWQEWFGGDASVIGRTVILRPAYVPPLTCTIVGVAPAGFAGLEQHVPGFWLTAVMAEHFRRSQSVNFRMAGLLGPGLTREQAAVELDLVAQNIARKYKGAVLRGYGNEGVFRSDLKTQLRPVARGRWGAFKPHRELQRSTLLASAVGGLILLIACANLSNLMLARADKRGKEMAIRLSIGASRWHLFRQLLTESVLLALLGGAAGLAVARWTNQLLLALKPADLPFVVQTSLDYRVVCFALLLAIFAGLIFGTVPAWKAAHCDLNVALKNDPATGSIRRFPLRDVLVVAQIALCLLLLIGAGLCLRSFAELQFADPGFNTKDVLVIPLQLKASDDRSADSIYQEISQRLEALPGIRAVSFTRPFPMMGGGSASVPVDRIEGYTPQKDEFLNLEFTMVGPRYFEVMGIPILQAPGTELRSTGSHVWINESFARRYWPGQAPVGKRMGSFVVSGIVKDCQVKNLTEKPQPHFYLQRLQPESGMTLMIRTDGNTRAATAAALKELAMFDRNLDLSGTRTMRQVLSESLASQRFLLFLLGGLALGAMLLATLGVYGVMAHLVARRTREIGVRIALGAQRWDVLRLTLRHGTFLIFSGITLGVAGALATTRALSGVLYEISPADPLTFVLISWLLAGVAFVACLVPARRATQIDPMVALRHE
jgi:predicted permease